MLAQPQWSAVEDRPASMVEPVGMSQEASQGMLPLEPQSVRLEQCSLGAPQQALVQWWVVLLQQLLLLGVVP